MKCEKCKTKNYTEDYEIFINTTENTWAANRFIQLKLCRTCYLKVSKFYYEGNIPEYISRKQYKQYLIKKNI